MVILLDYEDNVSHYSHNVNTFYKLFEKSIWKKSIYASSNIFHNKDDMLIKKKEGCKNSFLFFLHKLSAYLSPKPKRSCLVYVIILYAIF